MSRLTARYKHQRTRVPKRRASGFMGRLRRRLRIVGRWLVIVGALLILAGSFMAWHWIDFDSLYKETYKRMDNLLNIRVKDVIVEGRAKTTRHQAMRAIDIKIGVSMFSVSPALVHDRLLELPWVKSVIVQRKWPSTIYIRLSERTPIAVWTDKSKTKYIVDQTGYLIEKYHHSKHPSLFAISGEDAPAKVDKLLSVLNARQELKNNVRTARLVGKRRWDIILNNSLLIKLPEDDISRALDTLELYLTKYQVINDTVAIVDLRQADRSYLVLRSTGKIQRRPL